MELLNIHAPIKLKYVRANNGPFMTKELRKAIMLRSRLKNVFNRDKSEESKLAYTKQRNKCTQLLRKSKRNFYSSLNPRFVSDTKTFWKTVKPFFSEKISSNENIVLIEKEEIISEDNRISELFNDFFRNAVINLNVDIDPGLLVNVDHIDDPILKAIEKYKNHPSIIKIKEVREIPMLFEFNFLTMHEVALEIRNINSSKSNPIDSIPAKMIKENSSFFCTLLYNNFKNCISTCTFPNKLKLADVTPVHKKGVHMDKSNYRPVSILPAISKIYERVLYTQMNCFTENILSKFQCGFRKGTSAQHCLIVMLEKWKKSVDMKGCSGALLTDLSKAFDCLSHDLLIAKLEAYGFHHNALRLLHSYLSDRYQRVRVNSNYSSWSEIICGVPQGSILGPLLFNIYLSDLFIFLDSDIANYADDNTPYATCKDIESVIKRLESESIILFQWIGNNALKANPDKSHLLLNSNDNHLSVTIDDHEIFNSEHKKLLGITIDNELKFNEHVSTLCKKASQKLHALSRVAHFMNEDKRRVLMKTFI